MKSTGRAWVTEEIDETGEAVLVLNFCKQFLEDLGWNTGDELYWTQGEKPDHWIIKKIPETGILSGTKKE